MEQDDLEKQYIWLLNQISDYRNFVDDLANEKIKEYAPPFLNYNDSDTDILSFMECFFNGYIKKVESLPNLNIVDRVNQTFITIARQKLKLPPINLLPEFNLIRDLKSITSMILRVIELYLLGSPALAYDEMEKVFDKNNRHLFNLLPQLEAYSHYFYRIRKGKHTNKLDLFHTPFEKRFLCASYRFSILGLPALYCAETLETCILETRIEDECDLTASLFHITSDEDRVKKFVDLTLPGKKELKVWEQYSLILFYPLIVACSLKVKEEGKPFKPEYIIPQVFYQYIRKSAENFIGIAYTSTRFDHPDFTDFKQRNYVLFVKDSNQKAGYSKELGSELFVTKPFQFKFNKQTNLTDIQRSLRDYPFSNIFC